MNRSMSSTGEVAGDGINTYLEKKVIIIQSLELKAREILTFSWLSSWPSHPKSPALDGIVIINTNTNKIAQRIKQK